MTKVKIHEAKTNLSKLIAKVEAGEEVVICRGDEEVARLVAAGKPKRGSGVSEEHVSWDSEGEQLPDRKPGSWKGKIEITDAFYDPWSPKDFGPGVMDSEPDWGEPGTWDGRSPRKPGLLKGVITLDDTFFDPLSPEEMGLADDVERKR
jgi:antitoxin (DNA-binding transcriptional repressor) of toxin-antitoxin stability system